MCRVLVVDDDPEVAKLINRILNFDDYRVTFADTLDTAASLIDTFEPRIIILDLNLLNNERGEEVLKSVDPDKILTIVMTGQVLNTEEISELYELGATYVINKPIDSRILRSMIKRTKRLSKVINAFDLFSNIDKEVVSSLRTLQEEARKLDSLTDKLRSTRLGVVVG